MSKKEKGELYKKILAAVELDNYKAPYIGLQIENKVKEILDEVKADFPCYPRCKKYDIMMDTVSERRTRCDLGKPNGCYAWKKWIEKWWFGEVENK